MGVKHDGSGEWELDLGDDGEGKAMLLGVVKLECVMDEGMIIECLVVWGSFRE